MLVGQFTQKAREMHNEIIDLPDTIEVSATGVKRVAGGNVELSFDALLTWELVS